MGTTYAPRITDADTEAAFSNKKPDLDPEVAAALEELATEAHEHALNAALTLQLEAFVAFGASGYNGHCPESVTIDITQDGRTFQEDVEMIKLHEANLLTQLVFIEGKTYGRVYGAMDSKGSFTPMTLLEIYREHKPVAINSMAATLVLGGCLDEAKSTVS